MYRNRPGPVLRRKCRSVVWPRRIIGVSTAEFESDPDTVRTVFRRADAANKRTEDFIGTLNSQRK